MFLLQELKLLLNSVIDYTFFYQEIVNKGFDPILFVVFSAPQAFGETWTLSVK